MAQNRATVIDLAKGIDEMVMSEIITRQTFSKHVSPFKERKPEAKPLLNKPASFFGKKPLVFYTTSPPPVHQHSMC
jgi:hypothetical protein